jgi:hypothetical protein
MEKMLAAVLIVTLVVTSSIASVNAAPATTPANDIAKIVFVHYKAPAKLPGVGNAKKNGEGYQLYQGGVKWSTADLPVSYVINTANSGVNSSAAFAQVAAAFEAWDSQTSRELFDDSVGTTDIVGASIDGSNVISWTNLGSSGVIAVTTFWYNTRAKKLIEFDIQFNTYFPWGIDPDGEGTAYSLPDAMDIRNIATHEAGHTLVLNDLYQSQYSQMTMYGYSDYSEVSKISLEAGDIAGVHALYGN